MIDPYRKWLGIAPEYRPPTPHQLLGLSPEERDPEVIETAARRQSAFVKSFQAGEHGALARKLLGEIAEARRTLLARLTDPDTEGAGYALAASAPAAAPQLKASGARKKTAGAPTNSVPSRSSDDSSSRAATWTLPVAICGTVVAVGVGVVLYLKSGRDASPLALNSTAASANPSVASSTRSSAAPSNPPAASSTTAPPPKASVAAGPPASSAPKKESEKSAAPAPAYIPPTSGVAASGATAGGIMKPPFGPFGAAPPPNASADVGRVDIAGMKDDSNVGPGGVKFGDPCETWRYVKWEPGVLVRVGAGRFLVARSGASRGEWFPEESVRFPSVPDDASRWILASVAALERGERLDNVCRRLALAEPVDEIRPRVAAALHKSLRTVRRMDDDLAAALLAWCTEETRDLLIERARTATFSDREAVRALASFPAAATASALCDLMDNIHVKHEAASSLKKLGPVAEPSVIRLLRHDRSDVRKAAVEILLVIGTEKCESSLRSLIGRDKVLGPQAKIALGEINARNAAARAEKKKAKEKK